MTTLSLYEFAVPVRDNDGATVPEGRHLAFENFLMEAFGGYTKMPVVDGAWRDDNGRIYYDRMRSYRVAGDYDDLGALVQKAHAIYPDQKAFFVAEVGRAWIVPAEIQRPQAWRLMRTAGKLANVGNEE